MDVSAKGAFTTPQVRAAVEFTNETATMLGVPQERVQIMRDTDSIYLLQGMRRYCEDELQGNDLARLMNPPGAEAPARIAIAALVLRERELA